MHEVLVNRLGGLSLPRKSVVRLTDRPDMTLDVYRGRKTTIQPTNRAQNTMTQKLSVSVDVRVPFGVQQSQFCLGDVIEVKEWVKKKGNNQKKAQAYIFSSYIFIERVDIVKSNLSTAGKCLKK